MGPSVIELDDYRRRSRVGLDKVRLLLQQIAASYPEGRQRASIINVLSDRTYDNALQIFGMCLDLQDNECLSPAARASVLAHDVNNKLSEFMLCATTCPDENLAFLMTQANRMLKRLIFPAHMHHLL